MYPNTRVVMRLKLTLKITWQQIFRLLAFQMLKEFPLVDFMQQLQLYATTDKEYIAACNFCEF